jgi:hypothetical protein
MFGDFGRPEELWQAPRGMALAQQRHLWSRSQPPTTPP